MWNWRRTAFFALDRIRGGPYRDHIDDLAAYFADPVGHAPRVEERLRRFLDHATGTTDEYALYRGVTNLQDFPVTAKEDVIERRTRFTSSAFNPARLPSMSTSGSYGTPFRFPVTNEKWIRMRAEIIFFNRWAGIDVGDRHGFSGVTAKHKPRLTRFLQNQVWMDPTILSDARLTKHCDRLRVGDIRGMVAQPSFMAFLARSSLAHGWSPSDYGLKGVVVTAESLDHISRREIEAAFGCPVLGRYATRELCVLAMECLEERRYHINPTSAVIELLALDKDEPVRDGEIGRVVVTDLFSHALPLIRYDTGDLAIRGEGCHCGLPGPVLTEIVGRSVEILYDPSGTPIYPTAVSVALSEFDNIVQFQFIQRGENLFELLLSTLPEFTAGDDVLQALKEIFGADANISITSVEVIPSLPSGKRAYAVNEWSARQRKA